MTAPLIPWQPIAAMPDDRKDGRDLLIWSAGQAMIADWREGWGGEAIIGLWHAWNTDPEWWIMPGDVTHWADLNPPEQGA